MALTALIVVLAVFGSLAWWLAGAMYVAHDRIVRERGEERSRIQRVQEVALPAVAQVGFDAAVVCADRAKPEHGD